MQITAFDYAKDCTLTGGSLAKLATLVDAARQDARSQGMACLLLDNGDTLQGTPLADYLSRNTARTLHPMVACMNHMRYDAGGLGNHDFDHGMDRLADALAQHKMAVLCSNLTSSQLPTVQPSTIIECAAGTTAGDPATLRIGVLSSLPDKTAVWSRHHVRDKVDFQPPLPVLRSKAAELRAAGADVVIVLAHMGLAVFDEGADPQNRIADVAALDDVDVVIGGHTHLRFPGPEHRSIAAADCDLGTVHGKPVVQPGPSASDLGCIDLVLTHDPNTKGWRVASHHVALLHATADTVEDPAIKALVNDPHVETRCYLAQPVAKLKMPMNSYFSLAQPGALTALLAAAKKAAIEREIIGTDNAALPLLVAASAPAAGGFEGPENFLDLSEGQMKRHHVAGLNPYANHAWAVKTNGAQLVDWLERAAMIYNTLAEDDPDQMLLNPHIPGFRFDTIYGLTYEIDLREPPRYDTAGRVLNAGARIRNIHWQGAPLEADQEFMVATTDHRAGGGGLYKTFADSEIAVSGHRPLHEALLTYMQEPDCTAVRRSSPWRFLENMNRSAILLTAPEAVRHLDEIAVFRPEVLDLSESGFQRLRLHF